MQPFGTRKRAALVAVAVGALAAVSTAGAFVGGAWHVAKGVPESGQFFGRPDCVAAGHCWVTDAARSGAQLFVTTNGGRTWRPGAGARGASLGGVSCTDATTCWAFATSRTRLELLHSTTGGQAWQLQATVSGVVNAREISCVAGGTCIVVGAALRSPQGAAVWTDDGGSHWQVVDMSGSEPGRWSAAQLTAVSCTSALSCWATAFRLPLAAEVGVTHDGGKTWHGQTIAGGIAGLGDISCVGAGDCWAGGGTSDSSASRAVILATKDGGARWVREALPAGLLFVKGVACVGTRICFAGGTTSAFHGAILHTQDGGLHWTASATPSGVAQMLWMSCPEATDCLGVGEEADEVHLVLLSNHGAG